jgi:hypothetical protein
MVAVRREEVLQVVGQNGIVPNKISEDGGIRNRAKKPSSVAQNNDAENMTTTPRLQDRTTLLCNHLQHATTGDLIKTLNEHDVLLGRGHRPFFSGNIAFRELVDTRKAEYTAPSTLRKDKDRIGREVMNEICTRGGRFLCLVGMESNSNGYNVELWKRVTEKAALDKIKMALRQKKLGQKKPANDEQEANKSDDTCMNERETSNPSVPATDECSTLEAAARLSNNSLFSCSAGEDVPLAAELTDMFESTEESPDEHSRHSLHVSTVLPSSLLGGLNPAIGAAVAGVDATLNIFQQSQLAFQQQPAARSSDDESHEESTTSLRSASRYCRPDTNSLFGDSQGKEEKAKATSSGDLLQWCYMDKDVAESVKTSARDMPMEDEAVSDDVGLAAAISSAMATDGMPPSSLDADIYDIYSFLDWGILMK